MEVTALIPNWNGKARLPALLADLRAQTMPCRVLLVDNGSEDGSDKDAEASGAAVLRFTSNRGFAVAINAGMARAQTGLVAILNNDVRLEPQWLERLVTAMDTRRSPFAAGKLLSLAEPSKMDGCFDAICRGGCAWRCGHGRSAKTELSAKDGILLPPFTAFVIRREFFLQVGGLDESFGSYLEDVEFGIRSAARGFTGIYVPDAIAYHEGSGTLGAWSPRVVRQIARNQMLIVAKHYSTSMLLRWAWPVAVSQLLWGVVALKHGTGLAWLAGKWEGLGHFGSLREQHRLQSQTASVEAVILQSERHLLALQRSTGWDLYWRIYFLLT